MSKRIVISSLVAVSALLVAGCGGSSDSGGSGGTSPTVAWADGLCSAITTWTTSIAAIGDTFEGGGLSGEALTSAVDDAKSATETLSSDLGDLGRPEAGRQAEESLAQLSTDLEAGATRIEEAVDGASGLGGTLSAVSVVSSTLVTMGNRVSSTISSLESLDAGGELESAFQQAQSCDKLTG